MSDIFLNLFNLSIIASWLVLAVIVARMLLKKAPKYIRCILWGLVGLRLVFPFSIESVFSLIPSAKVIEPEMLYDKTPTIHSGVNALDTVTNGFIGNSLSPNHGDSVNPLQIVTFIASNLWVTGMIVMLLYCIISYVVVKRKVYDAIKLEGNVYECDKIATPFVLGVIKPRVYIPYHMDKDSRKYVITHEKAHIKRGDHITKIVGFILLTVYWFNPFIWIAYGLLCKDIELSCDEKVMKNIGEDKKKQYSKVLLEYSVSKKVINACPLAFGQVAVKQRIKNVLNYKKPAFWIVILSVIVCIVVAVCFMTSPKESANETLEDSNKMATNGLLSEIVEDTDKENIEDIPEDATTTTFDEMTILLEEEDIYSVKMTNGNTGEETSRLMSDTSMQDILTLYYELELFEPYEEEKEERRVGYPYCLRFYDVDGNLLQSVIPYKDSVQIDGVRYNCDNKTNMEMLTYLDLVFSDTESTEGIFVNLVEYDENGATLEIINNTDYQVTYTEYFNLLMQNKDGKYLPMDTISDNVLFHDVAYVVDAGKIIHYEIDWQWLYGSLGEGKYILTIEIYMDKETESYDSYNNYLYECEFELS